MNRIPSWSPIWLFKFFLTQGPGVSGELASVATSTDAVWTVWRRVRRVHEGVFFSIHFERGRRLFFFSFQYCWFWISGYSAPGFVNDVFRYKIQTMLSLDTITHLQKLKKQERSNVAASHQSRRGFCLLFAVFLFFFFFLFFILLYMADTEWESVCRKQLNTVTNSATVHYCHHKFLSISFTTSFQLSGSFFFLLILFFLYIYKIIQSVSSREDIIDGISLIRLNVKQEGL